MKEEDIDKILKNKINEEIKAPESLKNRISYEINNMGKKKNTKTKLRLIQSIAAVAVFSILGVTTYATITKNPILEKLGLVKGSATYEEVAKDINQDLSNEYAKITLKRMASDNAYIIMHYNVVLNEAGIEKFGQIEKDIHSGYDISIYNSIKINNKKIDIAFDTTEYSNKISDTEYDIYQIIQIANIDSKELNIEISEKSLEIRENQAPINRKVIISTTKKEDTKTFKKIQNKIDNKTIIVESFQNTSFETFIKVSVDIKNIKEENIENFYSKDNPQNLSFTVLDTNNNYVPHICYKKVALLEDEKGNRLDILTEYEKGNISFENTTAHMEYIITLGDIDKEISDVKLIPYTSILPNDRTGEDEKHYNNLEWHKLQSGNYKQKNPLGGEIELTKMEADNEKIKFAYNLTGIVTNIETPVLLRIKDKGFNVIYPTNIYIKGIDAEENYVEFDRNEEGACGYSENSEDEEDFKIEDISKVEFALLEKIDINLLDLQVDLKIPSQSNQYLTIKSIETKEIEESDEIEINEENVINEIVDLPNDNIENENINNTKITEGQIGKFEPKVFNKNDNFMGDIKLGMTYSEVKEILGEPYGIVTDDAAIADNIVNIEESQIEDGVEYQYGKVSIVFAKEEGKNVVDAIRNIGAEYKCPRGERFS